MRTPLRRERVVRVHGMPRGTRFFKEHPDDCESYVSAEEFTPQQAQLLEAALNGDLTIEGLLARWAS